MKYFLFGLMFLPLCRLRAQQQHFIYIESEAQQPFAVVMNGKVFSSSDAGYVILPKLTDGEYNFTISFPLNKFPDQQYNCTIDKKDIGFTLHNNGDKTWALQNMLTQNNQMNTAAIAAKPTQDNSFNAMLSQAVNDTTRTVKTAVKNTTDTALAPAVSAPVTAVTEPEKITAIQPQKISEMKQDTGTAMVFVDASPKANDTINVFIPYQQNSSNTNQSSTNNTITATTTITADSSHTTTFIDTAQHETTNPFYKPASGFNYNLQSAGGNAINQSKITAATKTDCSNMLNDNELDKLKRKMFVQKNDNNAVQLAVKTIGIKCITTEQVKSLGNIFSSDDGRYNLYDALYKNVYDYGNYANLEAQILDPYYKRRFEAMLK